LVSIVSQALADEGVLAAAQIKGLQTWLGSTPNKSRRCDKKVAGMTVDRSTTGSGTGSTLLALGS
jgi:hypothetical protein